MASQQAEARENKAMKPRDTKQDPRNKAADKGDESSARKEKQPS